MPKHLTVADTSGFVASAQVGAVNGVAELGADGKVPAGQLPATATEAVVLVNDHPGPNVTLSATDVGALTQATADGRYIRQSIPWGVDWVNVRGAGYGAVGDGIADDTTAVQNAINSNRVVYFPPGTYLCSTLTMHAGTVLVGANPGGFTTPVPAAQLSTVRLKNGTNSHLLTGGTGVSWVRIQGLHLDGNKANNTSGNLVHVADTGSSEQGDWVLTDCYLENSPGVGLYGGVNRLQVQALRCAVYGSVSHGVQFMAADGTLQNCSIGLNGGNGVLLGASAWVTHINSSDVWSSTLSGIDSTAGASMVQIAGCGIDRHQQAGLLITGGSVSVTGCLFHSNSQVTNATYPHIAITSGAVSVVGTIFGTDGLANNPDYAIKPTGGTVYEWANRLVSGSTVTGYVSDVTKVQNAFTGSVAVDVASQINIGGSSSSAKITVKPASPTDVIFSSRNGAETISRFTVDGLGTHQWSSGAASADVSVSRTAANQLSVALSDLRISTAGRGLMVAEGSNAKMGTATLVAGTVTVATTAVTANSRIFLTNQSQGGTAGFLRVSARTGGTSFAVTSSSGSDTSTFAWMLVEPA